MVRRAAFLLLLLGLLGPGRPAVAQGPAPYTKADTLRAVRALFNERRSNAESLALLGGITTGLGVAAGAAGISSSAQLGAGIYVLGGLVLAAVGVPLLVAGKSQQKQLTPEREVATVREYEQGHALPPEISRRLERHHFRLKRHHFAP